MYQYSNSLIRQFPSSVTGNAAVGIQATVYIGETGTLASLFESNGTTPKSNPVTTDDKGFYSFSLADGDYRIVFSSSQFATLRISVLDGAAIREEFDDLVASNTAFRNEQQAAYDTFVLSQGWDQVGTFAVGFEFTSPNQVGQDVGGNWWRWNGPFPKVVTAGTLPSSDANYKLVGDGVLRSDLADEDSSVSIAGQSASAISGNVEASYTQNGLIPVSDWLNGETVGIGDYRVFRGVTWEANANGKVCGLSPIFTDFHIVSNDGKLWPDNFGATYIPGVNQTPAMQRMEDFARIVNKPTYYRPVIHYMQTKLSLNREPNMSGTGGGQSSIRNRKLNPDRRYTGTVFYSQVAGDYALDIDLPSYHFGGRIENITLVGRLDPSQPRTIGHGAIFGGWGWSAQVNNLSIEGFHGKNLTLNYMQDTVFNSLTLLDGSNGPLEPMLEFAAESNFLYFNNPHIEEFEYAIRVKNGTNAPWEVKFVNAHFEAGNYTNGTVASAPDPSLERRYTSSPIYSSVFVRDWTFEGCFFVPVSARALAADSDGLIDNKPYFIRFEDAEGVSFTGKTRVQAQGACDFLFIGHSGTINEFGRNTIHDITIRNANPTKYSVITNNTDIKKIQIIFDGAVPTPRLYGLNMDNGLLHDSLFKLKDNLIEKSEGYLINSNSIHTVGVGSFSYDTSVRPFKFTRANCYDLSSGSRAVISPVNGASGTIDMETLPHDAQIIMNNVSVTTVNGISNAVAGKRLTISNRGAGNVTLNSSASFKPTGGSIVFGQDVAAEFYSDDGVLRQIG